MNWLQKHFTLILLILAAGYMSAVIFAIYHEGWPSSERTGQIGDTFGGLLGPLINLITIIFLFNTFKIDRRRNENEEDKIIADSMDSRIQRLENMIGDFEFLDLEGVAIEDIIKENFSRKKRTYYGASGMELFFSRSIDWINDGVFRLDDQLEKIELIFESIEDIYSDLVLLKDFNEVYRKQVEYSLRILYKFKLDKIIQSANLGNSRMKFSSIHQIMDQIKHYNSIIDPKLSNK